MRKLWLVLALLLITGTAHAAISSVAYYSARANTVAITAPQAGDLIVVFAHRDGSTTAPSMPVGGGYTSATTVSGSTNSARLGWIISAGTETSIGTWSNATSVVVMVRRGTEKAAPFGTIWGTSGASANLLVHVLSAQRTDGTSWLEAVAASRNATDATSRPWSMIVGGAGPALRTSSVDCAGFSSEAGNTTLSAASIATNGSTGYVTISFELRAAQTMAVSNGSFALTGQTETSIKGTKITSTYGAFAETGEGATTAKNYNHTTLNGSFYETGKTVTFGVSHTPTAYSFSSAYGSFTGSASTMTNNSCQSEVGGGSTNCATWYATKYASGSHGTFTETGKTMTGSVNGQKGLTVAYDAIGLTGRSATLAKSGGFQTYALTASTGSIAWNKQLATLESTLNKTGTHASFALTGETAGLGNAYVVYRQPAYYSVISETANLGKAKSYILTGSYNHIALGGQGIQMPRWTASYNPPYGTFALTGKGAGFPLPLSPGVFSASGQVLWDASYLVLSTAADMLSLQGNGMCFTLNGVRGPCFGNRGPLMGILP